MPELFTRKELMERTGIPRSTLHWLLRRLEIDPVDVTFTFYGRPVHLYDASTVDRINEWLNSQLASKTACRSGKVRCHGGCGKYYPASEMISVYCERCYVEKSLKNLLSRNRPWLHEYIPRFVQYAREFLNKIQIQ